MSKNVLMKTLLFITTLFLCSFVYAEETSLKRDQENIANLLNLAQVSIQTISAYNNRLVLDREYNSIINNINLRSIPDSRLVDLLKELLDALVQAKLTDRERERIDVELQRRADQLFEEAASGVIGGAAKVTTSIATQQYYNALPAIMSAGSVYWDYRKNSEKLERSREDQNWEIDNQVFVEINQINKKLLELSWELYNEYNIPDYRRLTSEDIKEIIDVGKVGAAEKRLRLLNQDHLKNKFSFYSPYWFYLGFAAHQSYSASGKNEFRELSINAYKRYAELAFEILKKDEMLTSAKLGLVQILDPEQSRAEILKLLTWLNNNPPKDWAEITTLAICFEKVGNKQNAIKWAQYNVDREKTNNFFHQQVLARILLNAGNRQLADQTISRMLELREATVADVFRMMGPTNIDVVAGTLGPTIKKVKLTLNKRRLLSDLLIVKVPKSLHLKNGNVYIQALGYTSYDPRLGRIIMQDGVTVHPNEVKFDEVNELVIFEFGSREIDRFINDDFEELILHFGTQDYPISILITLDQDSEEGTTVKTLLNKFVSIGDCSYLPSPTGLVDCSDMLQRQFKESADGFLYDYALSESLGVKLLEFDKAVTLESLLTSGKDELILKYINTALKDASVNYWDIVQLTGKSSFFAELDLIPQHGINFELTENMINQITDLGNSFDDESSFGKLSNKVFKSEAVSNKLNASRDLKLELAGRWKAREEYGFKLIVGKNEFHGKYIFNSNRKQPVSVIFEDCYSHDLWLEKSIKTVVLEVTGTASPVKLVFYCSDYDPSQLKLKSIASL